MEVRVDGEALRALRAGAIAHSGRPTCYVFVYSPETAKGSNQRNPVELLVGRAGIEPATNGLRVKT